jgi:peptidoglycan/LPS O-acetylase OafA/YrhL
MGGLAVPLSVDSRRSVDRRVHSNLSRHDERGEDAGMKLEYRSDIDGLRAIAVLCVIAYHAFPQQVTGGFIGVDIFFVISGFLISGLIQKGLRDGSFGFLDFYARRIKRIFPALIVVLASCLVAGWVLLLPDEYVPLGKHVAAGAGFISNFLLLDESGYFDTVAEFKPLLHLWSLGVEERFTLSGRLCCCSRGDGR